MERFTAKSALLTGVDLIRRRPWLVVLWAALWLVLTLVLLVGYREVVAWTRAGIFDGSSRYSSEPLFAYALTEAVLQLVLTAVLWASAFRAILRPAERGPLRFGGEELFVLGALLVPLLVALVVSVPLSVVMVSTQALSGGWLTIRGPAMVVDVLVLFWGAVAAVWAFGRLQVAPFRCWRIARGRFWLLAGLVIGVVVLQHLAVAGIQPLTVALSAHFPGNPSPLVNPLLPRPADLTAVFRPPALLRDGLGAVIKAIEIAFVGGIVASAYRASPAQPQAASFSAGSVAEPS